MPKKIYIPKGSANIAWTAIAQKPNRGGWYDSMVGVKPDPSLGEVFRALGVTKAEEVGDE
jgi:hypothetical protein